MFNISLRHWEIATPASADCGLVGKGGLCDSICEINSTCENTCVNTAWTQLDGVMDRQHRSRPGFLDLRGRLILQPRMHMQYDR